MTKIVLPYSVNSLVRPAVLQPVSGIGRLVGVWPAPQEVDPFPKRLASKQPLAISLSEAVEHSHSKKRSEREKAGEVVSFYRGLVPRLVLQD